MTTTTTTLAGAGPMKDWRCKVLLLIAAILLGFVLGGLYGEALEAVWG